MFRTIGSVFIFVRDSVYANDSITIPAGPHNGSLFGPGCHPSFSARRVKVPVADYKLIVLYNTSSYIMNWIMQH